MTPLPVDRVYIQTEGGSPSLFTDGELTALMASACEGEPANPLVKLVGRLAAEVKDLRAALARAGGTVQRRRPSRNRSA